MPVTWKLPEEEEERRETVAAWGLSRREQIKEPRVETETQNANSLCGSTADMSSSLAKEAGLAVFITSF